MSILIFLACCWLAIPLIRIFLPLSLWILTRKAFWIGFATISILVIGINIWAYQKGQTAMAFQTVQNVDTQSFNRWSEETTMRSVERNLAK